MNGFDDADLDGECEFDAIDISILEDEKKEPTQTGPGRIVLLVGLGSSRYIGLWLISKY